MDEPSRLRIVSTQLARMRGIVALYHRRFFADVWLATGTYLGALALGASAAPELLVSLPFIALLGATLTAFDASHLLFSRHYARSLESWMNHAIGMRLLVGSELEEAYLFPLDVRKIVVARLGAGFSWFGFVTFLFTAFGAIGYMYGAWLAVGSLQAGASVALYVTLLAVVTAAALSVGIWWFAFGVGERRLDEVLEARFGEELIEA